MAEEAYGRLKVMAVKRSMNLSLITSHEPNAGILNADGNGGIPHIANMMLAQARSDKLCLLPALPSAWPTGQATGLRVRGNLTVDLKWKDGKVIGYRIASPTPAPIQVQVNGAWKTVMPEKLRTGG